jgi:high-affinity iron transporter
LIYKKSLRINLGKFFTYSGIALIVVASSVLHKGLLDLQAFGMIPGGSAVNWTIVAAYLAISLKPLAREILPFSVTR